MIPLFSVEGHALQALSGEKSNFYEILPPDLEGHSAQDYEMVISGLENDLLQCDGQFKLYSLGGRLYLNSFGSIRLGSGAVRPSSDPIATFLGQQEAQVEFYSNYLTQGNEFVRVLSVQEFPDRMMPFEARAMGDFVLCFKRIPKLVAKGQVDMKRKLHFSGLFKQMRDLNSEKAFSQAENILERVTTDDLGLFSTECYLLVRASTKEELDRQSDQVMADFKAKNGLLRVETRGLSFMYRSLIPGVPASFKRACEMPSDYLSYWFPFHRDFVHEKGLELEARSGKSVFVDIFHASALSFNVLITGTSGQGKSMMANRLLQHQITTGAKGVVLDLGNSFKKSAMFHGAVVLSEKFNPLQFRNPRYLKEFILAVVDEKMGKKAEGRLFEEIKIILEQDQKLNFDELIARLEKSFSGISYYFSEIREFFSDDVKPLNDFTYCDFGLYPDVMKAPLIIYLIECFKHLEGRKLFIFDECWSLLEKNANYIAECFRTFRKHNASAVAISQNLDDFAETQLGRVIIQTSFTKLLFKQAIKESEFIDRQSKLLLDSVQSRKGEYSEFLYLSETNKKPLRYVPTALEYELFTSDPADLAHFRKYMDEQGRFLEFRDAIKHFTKIKHPFEVTV